MKKGVEKNLFGKSLIGFLLSEQSEFCARFLPIQKFGPKTISLTKDPRKNLRAMCSLDSIVFLLQETAELRNIVSWKGWKNDNDWQSLIPNVYKKIINQLHLVINLAVILGLEAKEIGELGFYFEEQKRRLTKTGVNFAELGSIAKVTPKNPGDDPRIKLALSTITELETALNDLKNLFPWDANQDYSGWSPDYSRYQREYKRVFGFFVKECLTWGLDEDLLIQRYLEKHNLDI